MIRIDKVRHGLKYVELWFPKDDWKSTKSDMIRLHCLPSPGQFKESEVELQHTRWTDLTVCEEDLQKAIISKTYRYDIRRSLKDNVTIKYFTSQEINADGKIVRLFADCYHAMYQEKGMDIFLDEDAVLSCAKNGHLVISVAYCDEEPIVFQSYLCDKDIVILWHSCSNFRSEKEMVNIIARANKRLHWEDWLHFKELGVITYDWGGVFAFNSDNGIDQFKEAVGGGPHDYYHTIPLGNSLLGKAALAAYNLKPREKKL
jgi:hypothetical protein